MIFWFISSLEQKKSKDEMDKMLNDTLVMC